MNQSAKNTGIKAIAILLIITMIATLLPARMVIWAEDGVVPQTVPIDDFTGYFEEGNSAFEPEESTSSGLFAEYEQAALAKLGKPATVEDVAPYKRSDVSYEIPDISNAFTRNYALESGNYTRLIFGTPVNYKTNEGYWRKINDEFVDVSSNGCNFFFCCFRRI